ncbi:F-box only protein 48 [Otolemur garnettii]|uniref:F-box only protein 48 n=1 Tax=Otolemur garnettii TaxID=30611 RepID=UPI00015151AE|nr:F-box only protein 48 [Otolemur garnettii]
MRKISMRNNNSTASNIGLNSVNAKEEQNESQNNFVELLPPEMTFKIFSQLDIQSLCRASLTCWSWYYAIRNSDLLWKSHCLIVKTVCPREINDDEGSGYSWREILLRNYQNYQRSKVKLEWLSGRYSNICSHTILLKNIMYPMDVDTWGEILEAELER